MVARVWTWVGFSNLKKFRTRIRCQTKFLTSAKFLTYYCLSVIFVAWWFATYNVEFVVAIYLVELGKLYLLLLCRVSWVRPSVLVSQGDAALWLQHFASQGIGIKFGGYFFDVCCANQNVLVRCQMLTTSYSREIIITTEKHWTSSWTSIMFLFLTLAKR